VLADGLGRDLHSEALSKNLGQLGGVPSALLGELAFHKGSCLLGDPRRTARSRPIEETLQTLLFEAVEVTTNARSGAPGVSGDGLHVFAPVGEAQNLGTQTHFGFEVGSLLDLS
jgi:hypothetical protein